MAQGTTKKPTTTARISKPAPHTAKQRQRTGGGPKAGQSSSIKKSKKSERSSAKVQKALKKSGAKSMVEGLERKLAATAGHVEMVGKEKKSKGKEEKGKK